MLLEDGCPSPTSNKLTNISPLLLLRYFIIRMFEFLPGLPTRVTK
jgi:hypothetical protein